MSTAQNTLNRLVEELKKAEEPVLDAEALGEKAGVSAVTVRKYSDDLRAHEDVGSMKIDRARVYFYDPVNGDAPGAGEPRPPDEPPDDPDETVKTATLNSGVADPPWQTATVAQVRDTDLTVPAWLANLPYALAATRTVGLAIFMAVLGLVCLSIAATTASITGVAGVATLASIAIGGVLVGLSVVLLTLATVAQLVLSRPLRHLVGLGGGEHELEG